MKVNLSEGKSTLEYNYERLRKYNEPKPISFKEKIKFKIRSRIYQLNSVKNSFSIDDANVDNFLNLKEEKISENAKIVIYTCVTGNYDNINEPIFKKNNVDFVMFSDKDIHSKRWDVRQIPEGLKNYSNQYINRYIKMHPHELFTEYDYAIYIDGNVLVTGDITKYLSLISHNTSLATFRHCLRECSYDEAKVCLVLKKGNKKFIKKHIKTLRKSHFPKKYGLLECTLLFTKLDDKSKRIYDEWWAIFIISKCGRDQICLPYALYELGLNPIEVGVCGTNVYLTDKFVVFSH